MEQRFTPIEKKIYQGWCVLYQGMPISFHLYEEEAKREAKDKNDTLKGKDGFSSTQVVPVEIIMQETIRFDLGC